MLVLRVLGLGIRVLGVEDDIGFGFRAKAVRAF